MDTKRDTMGLKTKHNPCQTTNITVVLDRSGSMECCKKATIDGFNEFLNGQKACGGEATISLIQFDDQYETVYEGTPIHKAPKLNNKNFQPRGMTALNDAIGRTISTLGCYTSCCQSCNCRNTKQIIVIITDGQENRSREYTQASVASMVSAGKNKGWEFIFIGANQDAVLTGQRYNFDIGKTITYTQSNIGTASVFNAASSLTGNLRSGVGGQSFTISNREEAMQTDDA